MRYVLLILALLAALPSNGLGQEPMPSRVIALAPNLAELVYDLGAGESLVGRTQFSNYPPQVLALPSVGSYYRPNLEGILALEPDLCLAIEDGTPPEVVKALRGFGIRVLVVRLQKVADLELAILEMGTVLGRQVAAKELAARIETELFRVQDKVKALVAEGLARPTVLFILQKQPIIVASSGTFVGELIKVAGGVNLISNDVQLSSDGVSLSGGVSLGGGDASYPRLSHEEFLQMRPQVILTANMAGKNDGNVAELVVQSDGKALELAVQSHGSVAKEPDKLPAEWAELQNLLVAGQRVIVLDADIFHRPSVRSIFAIGQLVDALFSGLSQKEGADSAQQGDVSELRLLQKAVK